MLKTTHSIINNSLKCENVFWDDASDAQNIQQS